MFEEAAMRLYEARLARNKSKKEFVEYRETNSECSGPELGRCFEGDDNDKIMEISKWCCACREGQPFYLARKAACKEVGAAMRALMQLCKKSHKAL